MSMRRNLDTPWGQRTEWPPGGFRWFVILTTLGVGIAIATFVLLLIYK